MWDQIDFGNRMISLTKTKNKMVRTLRMTDGVYEFLSEIKRSSDSIYVFTHHKGKVISASMLNRTIIRFQKVYPDKKIWRCHDLRHSYAFHFLKKGGNMYQLQAILGHKTIGMTIDLYGQLRALDVVGVEVY